jgi:hypothetical protein
MRVSYLTLIKKLKDKGYYVDEEGGETNEEKHVKNAGKKRMSKDMEDSDAPKAKKPRTKKAVVKTEEDGHDN